MKRLCYVTADSDPSGEWMEVEATSVFHAAIYYCGACAGRSGGPPVPTPTTIITVRVDGREYRVREGRVITVRVDGREYRGVKDRCGSGPTRKANRTPSGARLRKRSRGARRMPFLRLHEARIDFCAASPGLTTSYGCV